MDVIGKTKIFRKDFDGRPAYSRGISSREYVNGQKGDWITVYEPVQFPKDTYIEDGSVVLVKGFEAVYKTKSGELKRKLVVKEFKVEEVPKNDNVMMQNNFMAFSENEIPF